MSGKSAPKSRISWNLSVRTVCKKASQPKTLIGRDLAARVGAAQHRALAGRQMGLHGRAIERRAASTGLMGDLTD